MFRKVSARVAAGKHVLENTMRGWKAGLTYVSSHTPFHLVETIFFTRTWTKILIKIIPENANGQVRKGATKKKIERGGQRREVRSMREGASARSRRVGTIGLMLKFYETWRYQIEGIWRACGCRLPSLPGTPVATPLHVWIGNDARYSLLSTLSSLSGTVKLTT